MRHLLDTHFVLWLRIDYRGISRAARAIINNAENAFLFTAARLREITLKSARYRADLGYDPRVIRSQMLDGDYEELPVTGQNVAAMDSLAPIHKDPFDRLLIAQAMVEGIALLTADAVIARYPGPMRKV